MHNDIRFCELIGDLSQYLDECSYNEFTIRHYWNQRTLNQYLEERSKEQPWIAKQFQERFGVVGFDVQTVVSSLAWRDQGWPVDFGDWKECFDPLTPHERKHIISRVVRRNVQIRLKKPLEY